MVCRNGTEASSACTATCRQVHKRGARPLHPARPDRHAHPFATLWRSEEDKLYGSTQPQFREGNDGLPYFWFPMEFKAVEGAAGHVSITLYAARRCLVYSYFSLWIASVDLEHAACSRPDLLYGGHHQLVFDLVSKILHNWALKTGGIWRWWDQAVVPMVQRSILFMWRSSKFASGSTGEAMAARGTGCCLMPFPQAMCMLIWLVLCARNANLHEIVRSLVKYALIHIYLHMAHRIIYPNRGTRNSWSSHPLLDGRHLTPTLLIHLGHGSLGK